MLKLNIRNSLSIIDLFASCGISACFMCVLGLVNSRQYLRSRGCDIGPVRVRGAISIIGDNSGSLEVRAWCLLEASASSEGLIHVLRYLRSQHFFKQSHFLRLQVMQHAELARHH